MDTIEFNPLIHLTALMLNRNRTNGLNIISALQPIFTSSFPQPRGNWLLNRVLPTAILSWISWPVFLPWSLPCMCMLHSTRTAMKAFSIPYICYTAHTYRQVPLCSAGEKAGWNKPQYLFLKQPFLDARFLRERRENLPGHRLGMLLPCFKPSYDAEKRLLCTVLFMF